MSVHRARHRGLKLAIPPPADPGQADVEILAAELLVLWRALPSALARDSAGLLNGDRHSQGGAQGSSASVNIEVVEVATLLEMGLYNTAAEAARLLNLERREIPRSAATIITRLPDWHRSLSGRKQPLAKHIRTDLERWRRELRSALRLRTAEVRIGRLCPHHRDRPSELVREADEAILAPALAAGRALRAGETPLTWRRAESVRCPACGERWAGVPQLRVLMQMIDRSDAAEMSDPVGIVAEADRERTQ